MHNSDSASTARIWARVEKSLARLRNAVAPFFCEEAGEDDRLLNMGSILSRKSFHFCESIDWYCNKGSLVGGRLVSDDEKEELIRSRLGQTFPCLAKAQFDDTACDCCSRRFKCSTRKPAPAQRHETIMRAIREGVKKESRLYGGTLGCECQ